MAFAPDVHVFPGGGVDEGDRDPRLVARSPLTPDEAAVRLASGDDRLDAHALFVAAVRELWEETGVLLARSPRGEAAPADAIERARVGIPAGRTTFADAVVALGLTPSTDALVPLSRWVTPPMLPRRFDTRFFAARLPADAVMTFAVDEVADDVWLTPLEALDAMAEGSITLWPPTATTLAQLACVESFDHIAPAIAPRRQPRPPRLETVAPGIRRLVVETAGGVPGQPVNTWLIGTDRIVIVDPGDPSTEAAEAAIEAATAAGGRISAIALTSAAPDHTGGAVGLAIRLGIPVFAAAAAGRRIAHDVVALQDGQPIDIGDLGLVTVASRELPDAVAFAVPGSHAVVVGDVLGPPPDRTVLPPLDEPGLAALRARIRERQPRLLLPAHGEPLAGAAVGGRDADSG